MDCLVIVSTDKAEISFHSEQKNPEEQLHESIEKPLDLINGSQSLPIQERRHAQNNSPCKFEYTDSDIFILSED